MQTYILALDQGTSSSRAVLFDQQQNIVGIEQQEFPQYYPQAGWVEHNPSEIWTSQYQVAENLLHRLQIAPSQVKAIGITNQRETTLLWDKNTGEPVYNAIVWQDKRTSEFCSHLKKMGLEHKIKNKTGLVIDSYFSATKLHWMFKNIQGIRQKAINGELLFGTVDTWLIWKLTDGELHITDYSNASRTLLFDINLLKWDKELLEIFDIPLQILPQVVNSSQIYGKTSKKYFNGVRLNIAGIAGDQQAALFGQDCFEPGMAKNTYGTGCFMLMNTGSHIIRSESGLLTTIAWGLDGKVQYALEGSVFIAGAAVKWLRDGLRIINKASETEKLAAMVPDTEGCYVVPAFAGLGAPYWDQTARGIIVGLTQGVSNNHLVRATLESLAYQTKDILDAMAKDSRINLKVLNVDGGASANDFLMQFQADVLGTDVNRPLVIESTALGAAALAGLAIGFWTKEDLIKTRTIEKQFYPQQNPDTMNERYKGWLKAVEKSRGWAD